MVREGEGINTKHILWRGIYVPTVWLTGKEGRERNDAV